jgi:hypothetical protein
MAGPLVLLLPGYSGDDASCLFSAASPKTCGQPRHKTPVPAYTGGCMCQGVMRAYHSTYFQWACEVVPSLLYKEAQTLQHSMNSVRTAGLYRIH